MIIDKIRADMYGGYTDRFHEILTLLTDPNLTTDDIPLSVCADDISFICHFVGVAEKERSRTELLDAVLTNQNRVLRDNYLSFDTYFSKCYRLNRYLGNRSNVKREEGPNGFIRYNKDDVLLALIRKFTEVD